MRRGSLVSGLVVVVLAVVGVMAAIRLGPAPADPPAPPTARSGAWFCPHGGGRGWTGTVALANPGPVAVEARITSLGARRPPPSEAVTVPPGREVVRPLVVDERGASTFVEVFGGYLVAGWRVRAAEDATGLGAEPCTDLASMAWSSIDLGSLEDERGFLVVMNPFDAQAVFDLTVFSPDAPPLRDPEWTDIRLAPGRAAAFEVSAKVPGKNTVSATVDVGSGRVIASTLSIGAGGDVRSALAVPSQAAEWYLPTVEGSGQGSLLVGVTTDLAVRFDAVLRSRGPPQTAGGLVGVRQGAQSAGDYPVTSAGPSMVQLRTVDGHQVIAGLRASGPSIDSAATAGTTEQAPTWIVLPTVNGEPWSPGLVVANPGDVPVEVTVSALPEDAGEAAAEVGFTIEAGSTASPPQEFLTSDPRAALLVRASGPVVALGGSTSAGRGGDALYALAMGIPVPSWVVVGSSGP